MVGRVLDGRFRVEALLGEGGLGQVYRGTHLRLGRPVAIKVMHEHHVVRPELRKRFDREARSLAALAHPNVVGVIDYGIDDELPFLVMDLLEGRTLDDAIHAGLPEDRVVPIFRDVLRAVAYAHDIGLVHRDLKPANVFLQRVPEIGEVVRVLDFGLAKFVDGEGSGATVTRAGMVIGTPAYMSPEQATASVVDARADVYSLGIVLFELVTGERPFFADDAAEVLRKHLLQPMPTMVSVRPASRLAAQLEPIVHRATEKTRGDRFVDAREMAVALDAVALGARMPVGPPAPRRDTIREPASIHVTISDVPASVSGRAMPKEPNEPKRSPAMLGVITMAVVIAIASWGLSSATEVVTTTPEPSPAAPPPSVAVAPPPSLAVAPPPSLVPPPPSVAVAPPSSVASAPPPSVAIAPPSSVASAPPPPDPWASSIPPQLAPIEVRVRSGHEISADQRALLYRFSSNHPHDPRGLLLLGHAEVIAHAYVDACHRYQHAFDVDHDARFDRAMRHDLVALAAGATTRGEAARMVRAIYGAEALEEITIVEGEVAGDRLALARLAALRRSVEGAGGASP